MSIPRGFGLNGKSIYENVAKPTAINASFVVTPTNGLGITSLKSNGYIENVFMHTSVTPTSNNGHLNPNPANGFIFVQFKNNFNVFLNTYETVISPTTGGAVTSTTTGQVYVIGVLGTTTAAQWLAAGVPAGFTPVVGLSFVAIATGAIGGTGSVLAIGVSGITAIEIVGQPVVQSGNVAANGGAYLILQCLGSTSTSVTTPIPTAPTAGSIINARFLFDGSSVSIPDSVGVAGL